MSHSVQRYLLNWKRWNASNEHCIAIISNWIRILSFLLPGYSKMVTPPTTINQTLKSSNDMMISNEDSCTERKLMENEEDFTPQVEISTKRSLHIHDAKNPMEQDDKAKYHLSSSSPEPIPNYPSPCDKRFSKTKSDTQRKFSRTTSRSIISKIQSRCSTTSMDSKRVSYPVSTYRDQVKITFIILNVSWKTAQNKKIFAGLADESLLNKKRVELRTKNC